MSEMIIGVGQAGIAGQGPHMVIVRRALQSQIVDAKFSTYGGPAAIACGQFVCEEVENTPTSFVASIDEANIIKSIGQMPLGREHCPGLAVTALRKALEQINVALSEQEN